MELEQVTDAPAESLSEEDQEDLLLDSLLMVNRLLERTLPKGLTRDLLALQKRLDSVSAHVTVH